MVIMTIPDTGINSSKIEAMKKTIETVNCIKAVASILVIAFFAQFNANAQTTKATYEYIAPRTGMSEIPPGFSGVGPVISGSVDYSSLPSKARKFLQKHCDGHAVVKCEKEFTSGDFKITLADGIDMAARTGIGQDIEKLGSVSISPENERYVIENNILYSKDRKTLEKVFYHINGEFIVEPNVEKISENAFQGQGKMTNIVLPDNLKEIGTSAFLGCSALTKIRIPSKINSIAGNCFGTCRNLSVIEIDKKEGSI